MADLRVVQSDSGPSVFGAITDADGGPYNLTDATVRFQMRQSLDRRWAVDAPAVVVDEDAGTVRYDWEAGNLATAGDYESRWQISFQDGTVEHTDPSNSITVADQ